MLILWGRRGQLESADDVRGRALDYGHYLPEEAPDETYAELHRFFAGSAPAA